MEVAPWLFSNALNAGMKKKLVVSQENVLSAKPKILSRR